MKYFQVRGCVDSILFKTLEEAEKYKRNQEERYPGLILEIVEIGDDEDGRRQGKSYS